MPKRGGTTANAIQERLKCKSPWFQSVSDPLQGADCKIPDETGEATGTLQLVQRVGLTTNNQNTCGIIIRSLLPNRADVGNNASWNFNVNSSTADTGPGVYGWSSTEVPFEGMDMLHDSANSVRVVSASITFVVESSNLENSGELMGWTYPYASKEGDFGTPGDATYTEYANLYGAALAPVNSNQALTVKWFPFSRNHMDFKNFTPPGFDTLGAHYDDCPNWEMGIIWKGSSEANQAARVDIVVNYEFLPKLNSLNLISAAPSPADAQEMDLVEQWIQEEPQVTSVSNKDVSRSPATVSPAHEDDESGFGMFMNVLEELTPIALGMLSFL